MATQILCVPVETENIITLDVLLANLWTEELLLYKTHCFSQEGALVYCSIHILSTTFLIAVNLGKTSKVQEVIFRVQFSKSGELLIQPDLGLKELKVPYLG